MTSKTQYAEILELTPEETAEDDIDYIVQRENTKGHCACCGCNLTPESHFETLDRGLVCRTCFHSRPAKEILSLINPPKPRDFKKNTQTYPKKSRPSMGLQMAEMANLTIT